MTQTQLTQLDQQLNDMVLAGQGLEAFDKFYADGVVMQENDLAPRVGKAPNRKYEESFFASIAEVHEFSMHSSAVNDSVSYSDWTFDITFKDGNRVKMNQVSKREWKNGEVVFERFFYGN